MMEYRQRAYPMFSACGLNCGLCPRHQTDGSSKCPGCSGDGFLTKHPTCGALTCSQRKGCEYCFQCDEFPCPKYDGAGKKDSFMTHLHQLRDMEKAKSLGMDAYRRELDEKIAILELLLQSYNDGRRKRFFCLAVNLLELHDLRQIMEGLSREIHTDMPPKERAALAARLLQDGADKRNIPLKLRK